MIPVKRFFKARFLSNVLTLASATAAAQLIVVLATPIITRLYEPEEFGLLAIFSAMLAVALVVSSLRYELAIPIPHNKVCAEQILYSALGINCVMSLLAAIVISIYHYEIAEIVNAPELANFLWLLPVGVVLAGSYKALSYWMIRQQKYNVIARTKIVQSASNVATQVIVGVAGVGALGLILGQLVGQVAGVVRLGSESELRLRKVLVRLKSKRTIVMLKRHSNFPKYDAPAALVDVLSVQAPNLLLAALFSPVVAGFYLLAERVLSAPMAMLGQAVGQVLFGSSRSALQDGSLFPLLIKIVISLSLIIVIPTLIIFFHAEEAFSFIFGEAWRHAGDYASWMVLGLSVQFVYSPISMVLMATNGQKINLYIHAVMLVAKLSAVAFGYYMASPVYAVIGFSAAGVVGYFGAILVVLLRTRQYSTGV